jgi:ribosome-associated toxin RatA of RatAB toxin-antitoxin module
MSSIKVTALIANCTVAQAYDKLCDFDQYPLASEEILSVTVMDRDDGCALSTWQVRFRDGIMHWTERDTFDRSKNMITFEQVSGDVDDFRGSWMVQPHNGGCRIIFEANLEMGIPSLEHIIGPIAQQTLRENIRSILGALFGGGTQFLA